MRGNNVSMHPVPHRMSAKLRGYPDAALFNLSDISVSSAFCLQPECARAKGTTNGDRLHSEILAQRERNNRYRLGGNMRNSRIALVTLGFSSERVGGCSK